MPAGGFDIKGRNGMGFTGAEEESARKECPISTPYTHLTCHPRPFAVPRPQRQRRCGIKPGVAPPRRYPGSRPHRVPYPARGCAVRARRGVRQTRAEWNQVHGCGRGGRPECISNIHEIHTPHMPPIRTIGTTPSGLLIFLAFTRGSASAAQPRASWQNPVGIPGGGMG